MRVTIDFRGVVYTTVVEDDESLVQRIEEALARGRNLAGIVAYAVISGLRAWDEQKILRALGDNKAFLKCALGGGCGISKVQFEKTGLAIDELGRMLGEEAVKDLRALRERVGTKFPALCA